MPRLTGIQDHLFTSAFQKGEEAAFDCLFREYYPALKRYANTIVDDLSIAEDIVQDCFVLLWGRRHQLQHVSAIKSYLYATLKNNCLNSVKRNKRIIAVELRDHAVPSVEAGIVSAEIARELYTLIDQLSPALQQIVKLYYLEGKTNREIAAQLDIEPDTVTRQRLRALIALRKVPIQF